MPCAWLCFLEYTARLCFLEYTVSKVILKVHTCTNMVPMPLLLPVDFLYEVGQIWQCEGIPLVEKYMLSPEHQLAVSLTAADIESDL